MSHQKNLAKFREAEKAKQRAEAKYQEARIKLQLQCPHNNVLEGRYKEETAFTSGDPPFRVCTDCGYAEEGWSCGYSFLDKEDSQVREVSRKEARKYVVGRIIDNEDHAEVKFNRKKLVEILSA